MIVIQLTAIVAAVILLAVAIFQVLLSLGAPLAEYSWGGRHTGVLPVRLRVMSLVSVFILLLMGAVCLVHAGVGFSVIADWPTRTILWIFAVFLALNTLGNMASQSVKEKLVMTPLSAAACLLCLLLAWFG
ncbi:hypothetical protein [Paenibacillus radicis (ex Gao et al. 2016)]|uniref:Uncharacterized protein n=1 Tax=Paenibacillus radicis (ex Gao et al. 2016) TaxID=1737354 RepID=A0A917H2A1_9BACL|nr:hypothetical protein [Paenibacillus radicis (ex Gao et al. 2016)]GGG65152.1 hypothetical protein GCM10010918_19110 [Paenibacillus radicis (ex Gao et al. 2016)]